MLAALTEAGYSVSRPFGENQRYDLVIDDGETLSRVQVKTGRLRGGVIKFSCSSSHAHRGGKNRPYFGEIDLLAVYCPQTRKIYLLPESALVATSSHLRVAPAKNSQGKAIRWASQYELP
ncbi:MAG: group I intron-associated PD-(D/E)XK endonuclease [Candidatus Elarobacter sp.]